MVEAGTAREEALNLARTIAANSAAAVKFGKEAFYQQLEMGVADAYAHATEVMVKNMMARDAEEGHCRVRGKAPADLGGGLRRGHERIARTTASQRRRRRGLTKSTKARSFGGGCRPPG